MAPLLISRQGYNTSTFCRRLLPPQFKQTFIDNLDVAEKKATLIAMAQSLLIKQVAGSSLGISAVTKFGQFLTNIDVIVRKRTNSGMVYLVTPYIFGALRNAYPPFLLLLGASDEHNCYN